MVLSIFVGNGDTILHPVIAKELYSLKEHGRIFNKSAPIRGLLILIRPQSTATLRISHFFSCEASARTNAPSSHRLPYIPPIIEFIVFLVNRHRPVIVAVGGLCFG